jgi:hypothetical protein
MVTRLIFVRVPEAKMALPERTWKQVCGTKMISEAYRESQPHKEIREATRGLTTEPVVVKTYEIVP